MKPSVKSPAIEQLLENMFGVDREGSIRNDLCVPPPIGCGQPIDPRGWSEIEIGEYKISGLCADCQRKIFDRGEL